MTRYRFSLLSVLVIFSLLAIPGGSTRLVQAAPAQQPVSVSGPGYAPGVILVGFKSASPKLQPEVQAQSESGLRSTLSRLQAQDMRPVFHPLQPFGGVATMTAEQSDLAALRQIYRVQLPHEADVTAAIQQLQADPSVAFAEPDYLAQAVTTTPDDPEFVSQWGMTKIQADLAWDTTQGSPEVAIAVIDAGIDVSHEDLAGQLWVNPGEIAGNGLDDDNNGFVDDVHGANLLGNNVDLTDSSGHGTQVAGIIAAASNNTKGIAGVCWACKLMVVKVMNASGVANYSDIAAGITYAAQKGAKVINLSLGGYTDSATLRAAITAAAKTAVVVGGAGNDNKSTPFYPAAYTQYALAVAGTTQTDTKKDDSNYGSWISVSAPGDQIYTSFSGGGYGAASGTSMAAPFVSGVAGLILSQHPDWSPAQVRAQIIQTADSIDSLNSGLEGKVGSGRINATRAVNTTPGPLLRYVGFDANGQAGGVLKAGATNPLTVTLRNDWKDAAVVTATLSTTSSDVTITKATAGFGPIAAGQVVTNISDVFQISVPAGKFGLTIPLTLSVNADGEISSYPFSASTESQEMTVSGTISTNTTWDNSRVYHATGNITIANGATLTIQPGTVIKFDPGKGMLVHGTLVADGTMEQPIRFTSAKANPAPGDWGASYNYSISSIFFMADSTPASYDVDGNFLTGTILRHSVLEYGSGVSLQGGSPYIDHNTLTHNNGTVISNRGSYDGGSPLITGNQIVNNMSMTIVDLGAPAGTGYATVQGNLFSGNGGRIQLDGPNRFLQNTITHTVGYLTGGGLWTDPTVYISGTAVQFRGNTFWSNQVAYDIRASIPSGQTIDLTQNYWGTTDPTLIQERIWDSNDDPNLGTINATPFLPVPDPAAPPIVYQGTLAPASPVGIQTVNFDLTFSSPMDQAASPSLSFHDPRRDTITKVAGITKTIADLVGDGKGGVWVACGMGGMTSCSWGAKHYDGQTWTTLTTSNSGLASNFVMKLFVASNGDVWFSHSNGKINRLRGNTWTTYDPSTPQNPTNFIIQSFNEDPSGKMYAISWSELVVFDGSSWVPVPTQGAFPQGFMFNAGIGFDQAGHVWLATPQAVGYYDGAKWTTYSPGNGLPEDESVARLFSDHLGRIWVIVNYGAIAPETVVYLAMFDGQAWHTYGPNEMGNLFSGSRYIWEDLEGNIWVQGYMGYPMVTDGSRWWQRTDVYQNTGSQFIAYDRSGNLWMYDDMNYLRVLWGGRDYPIQGGTWVDESHYSVDYDFTSLVPRGNYQLAVSGVNSQSGMPITPTTNINFTLDYAGQISDTTAPAAPSVFATGSPADPTYVTASWNGAGVGYRYAIGSSRGATDIINWTSISTTQMTRSGLGLAAGKPYWVSVQARNAGGLWSPVGDSSFVAGQLSLRKLYLPVTVR